MEKEIWKDIENFEGLYQISNCDRVKSLERFVYSPKNGGETLHVHERILKTNINRDGYRTVCLCKGGKHYTMRIARLKAQAFIPNPNNLPQVNHKDENKLNDYVDVDNPENSNLEWCTAEYNVNYGNRNKKSGEKHSKKVIAIVKKSGETEYYSSIVDAAQKLNYKSFSNIAACVRGERLSAAGRTWKLVI